MRNSIFDGAEPVPWSALDVRPLEAIHLDSVVEIEKATFPSPWPRAHFESELENPLAVNRVVFEEPRVVAYASAWRVDREYRLHNIAVAPECRRRGLGRWFLRFLLREAVRAGCTEATLEVRTSNRAARKLYEREGFVQVGVRRGYYQRENEDALLMTAKLGAAPGRDDTIEP